MLALLGMWSMFFTLKILKLRNEVLSFFEHQLLEQRECMAHIIGNVTSSNKPRVSLKWMQNLSLQALTIIFDWLILSKITYALLTFAGHITVSDKHRINKFFCKAHCRGLDSNVYDIDTIENLIICLNLFNTLITVYIFYYLKNALPNI